jgi:hypothetical protein
MSRIIVYDLSGHCQHALRRSLEAPGTSSMDFANIPVTGAPRIVFFPHQTVGQAPTNLGSGTVSVTLR